MVAALARLAERAAEHADARDDRPQPQRRRPRPPRSASGSPTPARSCWSRSRRLDDLLARYPLRGIKGPVGTQQDSSTCSAATDAGRRLEAAVAAPPRLRRRRSTNVGQVYPRSLDLDVVSALVQAAAGPASLATTIRLMAGQELVDRGLQARPGRLVGDAAQDEHPLAASASTASRAILARPPRRWSPGWPATSGTRATCQLLGRAPRRAARRVLRRRRRCSRRSSPCSTSSARTRPSSSASCERYLPFLATTKVLMAAVRAGVGREAAHEAIKEHAVAVALAHARAGRRGQRPARAARRRRRASASTAPTLDDAVADPLDVRRRRRRPRSHAFVAQVDDVVAPPIPRRPPTARRADPLTAEPSP